MQITFVLWEGGSGTSMAVFKVGAADFDPPGRSETVSMSDFID